MTADAVRRRSRRWWAFTAYAPGVILGTAAVAAGISTGWHWYVTLLVGFGVVFVLHVRASVSMYRSAYFRGRGEQLRDLRDGVWPHPDELDPHPGDPMPSWRLTRGSGGSWRLDRL